MNIPAKNTPYAITRYQATVYPQEKAVSDQARVCFNHQQIAGPNDSARWYLFARTGLFTWTTLRSVFTWNI